MALRSSMLGRRRAYALQAQKVAVSIDTGRVRTSVGRLLERRVSGGGPGRDNSSGIGERPVLRVAATGIEGRV
jgi:hypothetical protein